MSNRLDQQREAEFQPKRMESCKKKLEEIGFVVTQKDETELQFVFKNSVVRFWPYSGWHSGKTIKSGRGFSKLLKQL